MVFKDIIKKFRTSKKISQRELADVLSVSQSLIMQWEHGKSTPNYDTLELLADYFETDINTLIGYPTDKELAFKQGLEYLHLDRYRQLNDDDKQLLAEQFNAFIERLERK